MCRLIAAGFLVLLVGAGVVRADDGYIVDHEMAYEEFLYSNGKQLDCQFTVEMWMSTVTRSSCFNGLLIHDEKLATIEALLAKLKRDIPKAQIIRDPRNPRIIHLVEKSLLEDKNYVIEKSAALDFSGAIEDLPDALGKIAPGIGQSTGGVGGELASYVDGVTKVNVHIKREKIRDLLTDAVPLKTYGRILWVAKTNGETTIHPRTEITFIDP
jgi:hypothetical protein